MTTPLPEFANPPVVEVALSVQFDPLPELRTPQLGLLWQTVRERFPRIEEHPPLEPSVETFGTRPAAEPGVRFEMTRQLPVPRVWFLNREGTELIQVQPDRFVHNWRKLGSEQTYPRYEKHIRPKFVNELAAFRQFLEREHLGEFKANQCEVTYVNHIIAGRGWERPGELFRVLNLCAGGSLDPLPRSDPEELRMNGSFVIPDIAGEPIGRLRFAIEPAFRSSDGQPLFVMNLVARGQPMEGADDPILAFLDLGRKWIVNGFTALTNPEMHKIWGRKV